MFQGFRKRTRKIWVTALTASSCMAGVQASPMTALDDKDLKQVHGAGIDADLIKRLQQLEQGNSQELKRGNDEQARGAMSTQQNAALLAALELQTQAAPKAAMLAVNAVTSGARLGGTLIALTPVTMVAPIGLPLFGLPTLPTLPSHHKSDTSGHSGNNGR